MIHFTPPQMTHFPDPRVRAMELDLFTNWADGPTNNLQEAAKKMVLGWLSAEDVSPSLFWLINQINARDLNNGHRNVRTQYIVDKLVEKGWVTDDDPPSDIDMEGDPLWDHCMATLPGADWGPVFDCHPNGAKTLYWMTDSPIGNIKCRTINYFDMPWGGERSSKELRADMLEWAQSMIDMVNGPKT